MTYPPRGHPGGRAFKWSEGRSLPVLQILIICAGRGIVEWRDRSAAVRAGDWFLLRPGEWHRYRPDPAVGWEEEWWEFRGSVVSQWLRSGALASSSGKLPKRTGLSERRKEFHHVAARAGVVSDSRLLALAVAILLECTGAASRRSPGNDSRKGELVGRAEELLERGLSVHEVARALGVSYPTLHRYFTEIKGFTPKSHATKSRWARAEVWLADGRLSMKEIAASLGFHSASHFSLAFRKAYGCPPMAWRQTWRTAKSRLEAHCANEK